MRSAAPFCAERVRSTAPFSTSRTCPGEGGGDIAGKVGGGGFAAGGFLEDEEGGQGFSGEIQVSEDGDHLVGQAADFGSTSLPHV